jgi:hypothetical protein
MLTNVQALVNGIEDKTSEVSATKISDHTNVGTYDIKAGTTLTGSNITVTGQDATSKHYDLLAAKNYNYKLADGSHTEKIDKIAATITTTAHREYGETPAIGSTTTVDDMAATGMTTWDNTTFETNESATYRGGLTDNTAVTTNAGTYKAGTEITESDAMKNTIAGTSNFGTNYNITYADTYTVNKAPLTVTVTGRRDYGGNMTASGTYTTTGGATSAVPGIDTLTKGLYNIDVSGVKTAAGDSAASVLNSDEVKKKLATVDNGAGGNTATDVVGSHTNVGSYTKDSTTAKFTLDNTNAMTTTNSILNSGNYYVKENGVNTLKIVPIAVTITTEGSRKYGGNNPDTTKYTITADGLKEWDKTALYGTDGSNWKSGIINSTKVTTAKGVYGTLGEVTPKEQVLSYAGDSQLVKDLSNYTISYDDKFTIDTAKLIITITGSKTYSDATNLNVKTGNYKVDIEGLENGDTLSYTKVDNSVGLYDNVGTYSYGNGADTTNSITKLADLSGADLTDYDITYKTTFTVTPKDLLLTTTGSRIYGDTNDTIKYDNIADTTGAIVNPADLTTFNNYQETLKKAIQVDKSVTEQTDAGTYGTLGTTSRETLTYAGDQQKATTAQLGGNYNIRYVDELTITKRPITHTLAGAKEYGTGSEHTAYTDGGFTNVPDFAKGTINANTPKNVTNTSDRYTTVGDYNNSLLGVTYSGDWTKNYDITELTKLTVTPADFTYTADDTSYWRGMNIPPQSGKVTNRYGEDVSDLVGNRTWPTPADHTSPAGKYPIIGHGANDNSGNYNPLQASGNDTALTIKEGQEGPEKRTLIPGGWGPVRRPLLDIRYLYIEGTQGINRWGDAAYSITGGDNHKAAGVDTLSGMGLASSQGYIPAQGTGVGTFYSKDKDKAYRF